MVDILNPTTFDSAHNKDFDKVIRNAMKKMDTSQMICFGMDQMTGFIYSVFNLNEDFSKLFIHQIASSNRQKQCVKDVVEFLSEALKIAEDFKAAKEQHRKH